LSTSSIDIKLGTNTLTKKSKNNPEKVLSRRAKDAKSTSPSLGFAICGYHHDSQTFSKIHQKTKQEDIAPILAEVVGSARAEVLAWLKEFL
jgi:flagellar motility protein MotE (MotC chaperone)